MSVIAAENSAALIRTVTLCMIPPRQAFLDVNTGLLQTNDAAADPRRLRSESSKIQAIPRRSKPKRRQPPGSLPRSQATGAISRSRPLLCRVDHQEHASRTAGLDPSCCFRSKGSVGEFYCPPVASIVLVCANLPGAITIPMRAASTVSKTGLGRLLGITSDRAHTTLPAELPHHRLPEEPPYRHRL